MESTAKTSNTTEGLTALQKAAAWDKSEIEMTPAERMYIRTPLEYEVHDEQQQRINEWKLKQITPNPKTAAENTTRDELHIGLGIPKSAAIEIHNWAEEQDWSDETELEPIEEYHITVLYAPEGHEEFADNGWPEDQHAVTITGIKAFPSHERGDKDAIVLTVESDTLKDHHDQLADRADDHGIEISQFSHDKFKPHITIAYGELPKDLKPPKLTFETEVSCVSPPRDTLDADDKRRANLVAAHGALDNGRLQDRACISSSLPEAWQIVAQRDQGVDQRPGVSGDNAIVSSVRDQRTHRSSTSSGLDSSTQKVAAPQESGRSSQSQSARQSHQESAAHDAETQRSRSHRSRDTLIQKGVPALRDASVDESVVFVFVPGVVGEPPEVPPKSTERESKQEPHLAHPDFRHGNESSENNPAPQNISKHAHIIAAPYMRELVKFADSWNQERERDAIVGAWDIQDTSGRCLDGPPITRPGQSAANDASRLSPLPPIASTNTSTSPIREPSRVASVVSVPTKKAKSVTPGDDMRSSDITRTTPTNVPFVASPASPSSTSIISKRARTNADKAILSRRDSRPVDRKHIDSSSKKDSPMDSASSAGTATGSSILNRQATDTWDQSHSPLRDQPAFEPTDRDCTCEHGHKLDCPVHGMNADETAYEHIWDFPNPASPVGYDTDAPRTWMRAQAADQSDTRESPDQMPALIPHDEPAQRTPHPEDPLGCTCDKGHKLDCPVHGLHATEQGYDHSWSIPESNPVGYPQDQPRNYMTAEGKLAVEDGRPIKVEHVEPGGELGTHDMSEEEWKANGGQGSAEQPKPFIYVPQHGRIYVGNPGWYHDDLEDGLFGIVQRKSPPPFTRGRIYPDGSVHVYDYNGDPKATNDILGALGGQQWDPHSWTFQAAHGEPKKCKYCKEPPTKHIIWAEGMARVPVCDEHLDKGRAAIEANGGFGEINEIRDVGSGHDAGEDHDTERDGEPNEHATSKSTDHSAKTDEGQSSRVDVSHWHIIAATWTCPACGKNDNNEHTCKNCGYDVHQDDPTIDREEHQWHRNRKPDIAQTGLVRADV